MQYINANSFLRCFIEYLKTYKKGKIITVIIFISSIIMYAEKVESCDKNKV